MDKLKMHTPDRAEENFRKLTALFPNAVTESLDENGKVVRAIDKDVLMQEISTEVVDGPKERYQFTWPDKKKAMLLANEPIAKTLRFQKEKSVGRDGTPGGADSENIYIEGDNLDALKLLQETYLGKVKMIYIDPPYNTGNDFIYEDDFSQSKADYIDKSGQIDLKGNRLVQNTENNGRFHTDWLNMIYPRLKIAKDFLREDGVIFISINDCESDNLKKLCNETFGEQNFIATLIWQQRKGGGNDSRYIAVDHEYIYIYAKDIKSLINRWRIPQSEEYLKRYKEIDTDGRRYYWDTLVRNGLQSPIIINIKSPEGNNITLNSQWSKERIESGLRDGTVKFTKTQNGWSLHHKVYMGNGQVLRSILTDYGNNRSAGSELQELFGFSSFDYAKPSSLILLLENLICTENDIIMDFFSGSATTADATMQLNSTDSGNRQFILIQLPEITDPKSDAYIAGYKTICNIGEERIRRAGKKIKEETDADIDYGFRCFKVDSTNMKDVYYRPNDLNQNTLLDYADNIKEDRTPEDLLIQVMLDLGILLSSKVEEVEIDGKKVFSVADGYLMACFDRDVTEETVTAIAKKRPFYAVFRDNSMVSDSVAVNFDQIFETYSPQTVRKVL
jgi:adenine-specific DNA-methyltransferase